MQLAFMTEPHIIDYAILESASHASTLALDTETQTRWLGIGTKHEFGLSYCTDVVVISMAWAEQGQIKSAAFYAPDGIWPIGVREWLIAGFQSSKTWVFHNSVFDVRLLSKLTGGVIPEVIHDTMVLERLLNPAVGKSYALASIASGYGLKVEHREIKAERGRLHTLPLDQLLEYAKADTALTLGCYEHQQKRVASEQDYLLYDWECRAVREYCRLAAKGVALNTAYAHQRISELSSVISTATTRLQADGLTNPSSSAQRVNYIYEIKKIPKPPSGMPDFFTKGGMLSADTKVLDILVEDYPELDDLRVYMGANSMLSTLAALVEHSAIDGRIHSQVTITTQTGRRSSKNPNIQNLKVATKRADDRAGDMCGVLIADEGFTLVEVDLGNAENYMAAMLSGDDNLAAACAAKDFHSAMAARYFGAAWTRADKDEQKRLRRMSKTITFGTAYGMGAKKLGMNLGISLPEAQAILDAKGRAFPDVSQTKYLAEQKGIKSGYVNLWTGRRVTVQAEQAYTAWNYVCQGGVAELVKRGLVLIAESFTEHGWKSRVAMDMHDALILEISHDEWDAALQEASAILENIIPQELCQRTSPPVQWIARPDIAENSHKWGRFQWHPEVVLPEVNHSEVPNTSDSDPTQVIAGHPVFQIPDLGYSYDLAGWSGVEKFNEMPPEDQQIWRGLGLSLFDWLSECVDQIFEATVPQNGGLQKVAVRRDQYIKVLEFWLDAAPEALEGTGYTPEDIQARLALHSDFQEKLEARVRACLSLIEGTRS